MSSFRVRIDTLDAKEITSWCELYSKEYVAVGHVLPHGNPHTHIYFKTDVIYNVDAFRMRVKRHFKPEKASDYSVKKCEDERADEYISYMFNTKHGNLATLISHNIDSSRLDSCIATAKEVSDNFELSKKSKKSTSPTQYDMSCEVYQLIVSKYGADKDILQRMMDADYIVGVQYNPWTTKTEGELYEDCVKFSIQLCHKYRKGFDEYSLRKIVQPAYSRFMKGQKHLVDKMVQVYFRPI